MSALGAAARDRFPIMSRKVRGGKRLSYLDNAATSQKPVEVLQALDDYYRRHNANVHRGMHALSEEATELYEGARAEIAAWFGAAAEEVVFLRGATEAINLMATAWCQVNLRPGGRILITVAEHHSNLVPWQMAAQRHGAELVVLPLGEDDLVDKEALGRELERGAALVAFTAQSNVLAAPEDVAAVAAMARDAGAATVVDAAQAAAHRRVDVPAWGCDAVAVSGHKMLGPMGSGVLVARPGLLDEMPPFLGGGEMIVDVREQDADWAPPPHKFEAGTMNVAGALGHLAAVRVMDDLLAGGLEGHVAGLSRAAKDGLLDRGAACLARGEPHGVVAFTVPGVHPHDVATVMDQEGVAVRAGHHCARPLHRSLGVDASVRASFHAYNDVDDVEALLAAYDRVLEVFAA